MTFPETEGTGDLDFHAILTADPSSAQRAGLEQLYADLARRDPLCHDLDGWIISLAAARGSEPPEHLTLPASVSSGPAR